MLPCRGWIAVLLAVVWARCAGAGVPDVCTGVVLRLRGAWGSLALPSAVHARVCGACCVLCSTCICCACAVVPAAVVLACRTGGMVTSGGAGVVLGL